MNLLDRILFLKDQQKSIEDKIKELSLELQKSMLLHGEEKVESDEGVAFYSSGTQVDVEDWNEVMQFVKENNAFDILQRRISPAALVARLHDDRKIKGVTVKPTKTFIVQGKKGEKDKVEQ